MRRWWDRVTGAKKWRFEYHWSRPGSPAWSDWFPHWLAVQLARGENGNGRIEYHPNHYHYHKIMETTITEDS